MKKAIPVLASFVTGASMMATSATAQELWQECKPDFRSIDEYDLYQCVTEEYGIVPPKGGAYAND